MAKMKEAIKILFSGENTADKQICLFSLCGIIGLTCGILALEVQNIIEISILQKILLGIWAIIYTLFWTGYETIFLHTRKLPDITMDCFKIGLKKVPFITFLISIPFVLCNLFLKTQPTVLLIYITSLVLSLPLTMAVAGFSYKYDNNDFLLLFKKFKIKDYFLLLLKMLWLGIAAYMITIFVIFALFFTLGFIIAILYKGDAASIGFMISSHQVVIGKLSNFITTILFTYTLTISTLVWDYEIIKTNESED